MKKATLGDIGNVLMCRRILKSQTNNNSGIPFYKISTFGDVADCYISKDIYYEYKSKYSYPKIGEILISAAGTLGKTVIYQGEESYYQDSNIVWIRNDESKVLNSFLYYFYQTNPWIKTSGSTIGRLYNDNIKNTVIFYPESLEDQFKISSVLQLLDKKIQNNKKQIETLENLSKTIYDYWFVQFDFPNEDGRPYKSSGGKMVWNEELKREIPDGWSSVHLISVANFVKGKIPRELFDQKDSSLEPYITIDVANGGIPQYCSSESMPYCSSATIMVMDGAASGDIYVGIDGVLGSTFSMIKSFKSDISDSLIFMILNSLKDIYKRANTGSTVPHANRRYIENMLIPIPKNCSVFSRKFDEIFSQIKNLKLQINEISSLREFILPLLMNGQVRISNTSIE